ncbi:MAG TPA: hypothetical protein VME40_06870 [Caulobacteraceae bacterium]|nr:hypothetical protein [Caulobacteraceae bacterium]
MLTSSDHPATPAGKVWRLSSQPMIQSAIGVAVLAAATASLLVVAVSMVGFAGWRVEIGLLALAAFCGLLVLYVWRDMRGKRPWRIDIEPESVTLDLPANRSLIHRPPACKTTVPVGDIAAIETRLEVYKGLGGGMMQRPYRLLRKDGEGIFLFEERALDTAMATASLRPVATDIASRTGAPLTDLGMASASSGILGVWFVRAPDWNAAALPPAEAARLERGVRLTGAFALIAVVIAVVLFFVF